MNTDEIVELSRRIGKDAFEFWFDFTQKMRVRGRVKSQNYQTKATLTLDKAKKILDEYGVKLVFLDPYKVV